MPRSSLPYINLLYLFPLALSLGQWDNFISTSMSHVHMWFYLSTNKETTKEKRHDICLFETNWIWLIWLSPGAYIFLSNVTFVLSFWLKKYHIFANHSFITGHRGCFCSLALMNSTAADISVWASLWRVGLESLGFSQGLVQLDP